MAMGVPPTKRQARLEELKAAEGKLQGPRHKKERSAPDTQGSAKVTVDNYGKSPCY